jgi:hypothetical protein
MEILICKLKSGLEIIGKKHEENETSITLRDPLQVMMAQTQRGLGTSMMPIAMLAKDDRINEYINLKYDDCLMVYIPMDEIVAGYTERTSGIIL